ncbi:site-specific recombinase, phage integrase family [Prevotella amnii]|uniref:Site-specific recombinase, phage integrase family n=1 Tax=Prevotella amnii TaxID=419005 RepID=A0A134B369_9BACT|nr:site-specific integrase [Prevotella amnii]KXB74388.1 site-specific recombinase, phage integrase family [Prevotella amnii]DAK64696.1 MAG TPA: Integrase [Caudoviricetes sp.]
MATIKFAVLKHTKAKDGTYKIRISIGHKSETHYIVTPYSVNALSEFDNGIVVRVPNAHEINIKLRNLLNDYEERLERIPSPDDYNCKQLRDLLKSMRPHSSTATFQQVSEQYQKELIEDGRGSYAGMLQNSLRLFFEFTGGDVFLSEISTITISEFERWLKRKGVSQTYISMTLSMTRTIINRAIRMQLVTYNVHPFTYWKRPADPERELDISVEDMRAIRDAQPRLKKQRIARDIFMLSYYLGGINLIDLLDIDFRDVTVLEYTRHKSRNMKLSDKRISFTLQPEAKEIIHKWINRNTGKLDFGYKFSYKNFLAYITRSIKSLAKDIDIQDYKKVCYYTARKSFVQHGFDLGVSLEVLEYCIGQSVKNNRPIFNYLKIMRRHADVAFRIILDNLADA